jgi:pimeloyl-ACP methyl ester carboxylesterase
MQSRKTHDGSLVRITSRDGTPIAVSAAGSGPPLVCVDGALCTRSQGPGKGLAPRLSERFTVYTYDRRGRGDSGHTAPYSPEREIEDLEALIAHAGGEAEVCQTVHDPAGDRFASVQIPTLLLVGGKSPAWIKNAVHTLDRTLPHAALKVLDRQTHMVNPRPTAEALLESLRAESPTAGLRQGSSAGRAPALQPQP